jgi:hypothetical protein
MQLTAILDTRVYTKRLHGPHTQNLAGSAKLLGSNILKVCFLEIQLLTDPTC